MSRRRKRKRPGESPPTAADAGPLDLPLRPRGDAVPADAPPTEVAADALFDVRESIGRPHGDPQTDVRAQLVQRSAQRAPAAVDVSPDDFDADAFDDDAALGDERAAAVDDAALADDVDDDDWVEAPSGQEAADGLDDPNADRPEAVDDALPVSIYDADLLPTPLPDRLIAGLADLAVHLIMVGASIGAVILMGVPLRVEQWPPFAGLALIFSFPYWVIPLAFWGQTPGMAWIGHLARTLDREPLTFSQAVLRWMGALLTVALIGVPLLLALTGRSLSDRLSDSATVSL
ncbi:MAG: RDD family protein [Acidobacteriota bacterium]